MAKEVSLKLTYLQAPGIKKPTVEKLHEDIKEGGYSFFQKNPQYVPPFLLFASGVKSGALEEEIKKAPEKGIDSENVPLLENVNLKLKVFEEENPELFQELSESYQEASPQIELVEYVESPEYISLRPSVDNSSYELTPNSSFGKLDVDIGPAKEVASFGLNKIIEPVKKKVIEMGARAVTKTAASVATKAGVQAAAQTVGSSVPIIGNIAAWVATTIIGGILDRLALAIKKRSKDVQDFIMGGPVALLQLLSGIFTGLGLILTTFLSAIVTPILVALVSIPIVIAIIVFIINSGAYLVPPSMSTILGENPYIGITKEASQTVFSNDDLFPSGITVTYTITITPLRGSLTNISFSHECEVLSRRPTASCPAPSPSPIPVLITPIEPYVYTYSVTYTQADADYRDSLVLNTFTVTADTDEVTQTTATGSASIIIGDPPTGCYVFQGDWPVNYRADMQGAVVSLTSSFSNFVARVCTGGELGLRYNPGGNSSYWGFYRGSYLEFYDKSFSSRPGINDTIYILAHESGHALADRITSIYSTYEATPGIFSERPYCFYDYPPYYYEERFAEAIAFYAIDPCGNFQSSYPIHYNFVRNNVF